MSVITYKGDNSFLDKCGKGFGIVVGSVAFDSSYPTGGEALDLSAKLPNAVQLVTFEANGGYVFQYDYTNKKVKAFTPTIAHTHVFAGDALATHVHKQNFTTGSTAVAAAETGALVENTAAAETVVRFPNTAIDTTYELGEGEAKTGGTPAGTNANASAGAATEVANTTDLSALTDVRFMAVGY